MEDHPLSDQQQQWGLDHLDHLYQESDPAGTLFEQPKDWDKFTQKPTAEVDKTATSKSEINNGPTHFHEQQNKSTDVSAFGLKKTLLNYNSVPVKCTSNQGIGKYSNFSGLTRVVSEELTKGTEEHYTVVTKLGPPKTSATVQIFHSHYGSTIKAIEMDLEALLKNRLKKVDFEKCNKLKDIDQTKMLIVLCIITSRVGTDAAYAVKGIDRLNPANTILVLIHVKDSHALSKQASSTVLTDQPFRTLGGIFDLAFVNGKGIYQCEMNDISLDGICTFINKNM